MHIFKKNAHKTLRISIGISLRILLLDKVKLKIHLRHRNSVTKVDSQDIDGSVVNGLGRSLV